MEAFTILHGVPAVLGDANISTDAIIPSVWAVTPGVDLGQKLFANWRYDESGKEVPDFILNEPPFRGASILVAGANFGCGSSREAAVWALQKFGIRCVIATSFGEIFQENMFKNGLLPITAPAEIVQRLSDLVASLPGQEISVDLKDCVICLSDRTEISFEISPSRRAMLIEGLDDLGLVRRAMTDIAMFEAKGRNRAPWLYEPAR
jgi:3-isopropylmalate/(R)-2-methylmalate dehydratase small subunit